MSRKRVVGILLIVVSLALMGGAVSEVTKTVTLSGLTFGSTATYTPPFEGHGPLVVAAGVLAVVLFLIGLHLASPER